MVYFRQQCVDTTFLEGHACQADLLHQPVKMQDKMRFMARNSAASGNAITEELSSSRDTGSTIGMSVDASSPTIISIASALKPAYI